MMTARMMLPNNDEEHVRTYDDDGYSNDEEDGGGGGDDDADDGDGNAFVDVYVHIWTCRATVECNRRRLPEPTYLCTPNFVGYGILAGSR